MKTLREFRASENARAYCSPSGATGSPSILNATVEDLINIHELIDEERRKWLEKFRKIAEQAKEKQVEEFSIFLIGTCKIHCLVVDSPDNGRSA